MPAKTFQIRLCPSCGLRYPLLEGHPFGERCPACLSNTVSVLEQSLDQETALAERAFFSDVNLHVMLDNVRSAWNVGSILRTADGFAFGHAYLCGITPTPENADVSKTALGAQEFVPWSYHPNAVELVKNLKEQGNMIWALEQVKGSRPVEAALDALHNEKTRNAVLVVGNEVTGVDPDILECADFVVHLPMRGQKRSFNAAVAFAVAAYIMHTANSKRPARLFRNRASVHVKGT